MPLDNSNSAQHFPYIHKLVEQLISSILDTDTYKTINSSRIPQSSSNRVLRRRHQETIFPIHLVFPIHKSRNHSPVHDILPQPQLVSGTLINDPMDRFLHEFFPILYSR